MRRSALVVESGWARGALASARALRSAGWRVGVTSPTRFGLASASRSCDRHHRLPSLGADPEPWLEAVNSAIDSGGYELVLPAGDDKLLALSAQRDRLRATLPCPPHASVLRAVDKLSLYEATLAAGFAAPRTTIFTEDLLREWSFPAIVKARVHGATPERIEATVATDVAEAKSAAERICRKGGIPLLQERVAGRLIAFTVVMDEDGRCIACVAQAAERTWPVDAGVSTRAMTQEVDSEMSVKALRLLRDLGWTGIAQLQFIADAGSEPHLIDLNARLYGSLALAVAAGANLPAIWAGSAIGETPAEPVLGRAGVRYQWLEGDLRAGAARGRGLSSFVDSLRYARGARHTVWDRHDPLPTLASLLRLAQRAFGRLGGVLRRG